MPAILLRRTAAATAVTSLALLLAACGGGDKKPAEDTGKADASASAAAKPDVKALTADELEKLVVEQADLKGYQVKKTPAKEVVNGGDVSADKAACEPLAEAMSSVSTGTPRATAQRKLAEVPKKDAASSPANVLGALGAPLTSVVLGSYDGQGAEQAITSLKAAGEACTGGFTLIAGGEKTKVTKVATETTTAGDEALAWTVTSDMDGSPFVSKLVVFRKGNNLANFATISLSGKVTELPKPVIDAQAAKLH